jgi:hypothetical protein
MSPKTTMSTGLFGDIRVNLRSFIARSSALDPS